MSALLFFVLLVVVFTPYDQFLLVIHIQLNIKGIVICVYSEAFICKSLVRARKYNKRTQTEK